MRRAASRFSGVSTSPCGPRRPAGAPAAASSGKLRAHEIDIVHRGQRRCAARRASAAPDRTGRREVLASIGVERLVEHDHAGILQQQTREQHALHLAARQRPMARSSKPVRPTAAIACSIRGALRAADAAEQAATPPQPHRHHVVDIDRERAVDLGGLRQIGDVARAETAALDAARQRLDDADDALEQRRLAGTVRTDDRDQRTGFDRASR